MLYSINQPGGYRFMKYAFLALVMLAPVAHAASMKVDPSALAPGEKATVRGSGFTAAGKVDILFDGTNVGTAVVNTSGQFDAASLVIPTSVAPGRHWITA